jgi:hypothetical protein
VRLIIVRPTQTVFFQNLLLAPMTLSTRLLGF